MSSSQDSPVIKLPSLPSDTSIQPITLRTSPELNLRNVEDLIEKYKPELEPFSKRERLFGVIAVAIPVVVLATVEAFTGSSIFDTRLRNLLYVATLFVLVTVAYSVYTYSNVERFTSVGYLYLFFAIFTMLAMVAGRVGYGLAITSTFFMFIFVCMLYRETKEPLLIISILIVFVWAVGITLIYVGYIPPDVIG